MPDFDLPKDPKKLPPLSRRQNAILDNPLLEKWGAFFSGGLTKAGQRYSFFEIHDHNIIRCALMRFPSPPRDGLEPDWLTKAAGQKLPHRGRASPAAFGRQAALRID